MSSTWRDPLRDLLNQLPVEVSLSEIYTAAEPLSAAHPGNNSVEATLRRELQVLRDEGFLEFLGRGRYRRNSGRPQLVARHTEPSRDTRLRPETPDGVPLERASADTYVVSASDSRNAVRREQRLVDRFERFLISSGHSAKRWRITTKSGVVLFTDVFDETSRVLYEAKGSSSREALRMAIGQVLDYRRYLRATLDGVALLLPRFPDHEMIDLLEELGIGCVCASGDGFITRLAPQLIVESSTVARSAKV